MRALVVGAGAVGQTYGLHLQLGGAELGFLVKPPHVAELERGLFVYRLNGRDRAAQRLTGFELHAAAAAAVARPWDQLWLCVPGPALRGAWLDELLAGAGDATVVLLTPGLDDLTHVTARCPRERVVSGLISLVAYQTPLPGEERDPPGIACWFPPLSPSPFAGEDRARVDAVVGALRAGGCPAKRVRDVEATKAVGSATLLVVIAGLEVAGWSLAALRRGPERALVAAAVRETTTVAARVAGCRRGLVPLVASRAGLWLASALGPRLVPFDLEVYLRYHFTKVGEQTADSLRTYVRHARELGLPSGATERLLAALEAARAGTVAAPA